jgi:hypothetical protein
LDKIKNMRWLLAALLTFGILQAQTAPAPLDISSAQIWTDTKIDLRRGDSIVITATGTLAVKSGRDQGAIEANGKSRGFRDMVKSYQVNTAGLGALIGRIGSSDATEPFLVGARKEMPVLRAGRLFLGVNETGSEPIEGSYHVTIEFTAHGPETAAPPADLKLPTVTQDMIDRIPRRVTDAQGNAGDNVNFAVVGSEKQVLGAFEAAGWVKVDRSNGDAVLAGVMAVLSKQAYLTLPMSILTLFGRPQDYGLAHAEPLAVVAQRHHLRLWKAPFAADGQEVWAGAATHDIGFDRDQRNNGITHKIDPAVDDEREFVSRSLDETGLIAKLSYLTPSQPSKEARTATGATFHSDGRVLVIHLVPETAVAAQ